MEGSLQPRSLKLHGAVQKMLDRKKAFTSTSFCHVYNEQNREADKLSKQACGRHPGLLQITREANKLSKQACDRFPGFLQITRWREGVDESLPPDREANKLSKQACDRPPVFLQITRWREGVDESLPPDSNDAYDFETGADKDKKESVVNISGSHSGVLYAAYTCLALGSTGLLWGALQARDVRVAALLFGAILCGYIYQCPPCRLSYHGMGEPLCFAAFGPLATSAFYFSQASKSQTGILPFSSTILSVSVLIGVTTTLILFCSHFHQIDGDREVGKMSPLVRMGTKRGSEVVRCGVVVLYSLLCVFAALKSLPLTCALFSLLTLPIGKLLIDFVHENHNDKIKIFMAKYYCVRLHASFGVALALGLFAARFIQL